jgi:hypothetical protein
LVPAAIVKIARRAEAEVERAGRRLLTFAEQIEIRVNGRGEIAVARPFLWFPRLDAAALAVGVGEIQFAQRVEQIAPVIRAGNRLEFRQRGVGIFGEGLVEAVAVEHTPRVRAANIAVEGVRVEMPVGRARRNLVRADGRHAAGQRQQREQHAARQEKFVQAHPRTLQALTDLSR